MNGKIVVADDDFDNRTILREALEAAGFAVVVVVNGEEALAKTVEEKPDVLLVDLSMPKLTGWDVARLLRDRPELAGTAIIAVTAHALVGDELKARACGCDDYIAKPCLPKEVVQKVASWIGRKGIAAPSATL